MSTVLELPVWDLSGLYRGRDDPMMVRDLEEAARLLVEDTDEGYERAVTLLARLHAYGSLYDNGRIEAVVHAQVNDAMALSKRKDDPPRQSFRAADLMLAAVGWRGEAIALAAARSETKLPTRRWSWAEARALAVAAADALSPQAGLAVRRTFEEDRVHARHHEPGALTHPAGDRGPYVRMSFDGSLRSVLTLAHEMGHAAHQTLSRPLGVLQCSPRPALAETVAAVHEQTALRLLLARAAPKERPGLLAYRRADLMNVVVRHAALHRFEAMGRPSPTNWRRALEQIAGPRAARLERPDGWHAFPILRRAPGTAWTYPFARLVALALLQARADDAQAFARRWTTLLSLGGTVDEARALFPFMIDPAVPAFWSDAVDLAVAEAESA